MTIHHRITSSIPAAAATAALALGAAGPASAMPYGFNANGSYGPAGPVAAGQPSSSGSSSTGGQGAPPILPAPNRSQSAAIQRAEQQQAQGPAHTVPNSATYSDAETNAYADTPAGYVIARVIGVTTAHNGFDWGDAGIGAAGGIALSLVGLGGALAISQSRPRRTTT